MPLDRAKRGAPPPPRLVVGKPLLPSRSTIGDGPEKERYWSSLLDAWAGKRKKESSFPGCNPVGVGRATLPLLSADPYSIALKSDGVRYALFCTTRPSSTPSDPHPVALMVDRAGEMHEVEVVAREEVFVAGTIFEGELVWKQPEQDHLLYLVFDCVLSSGRSMLDLPFSERIKEVHRCVHLSEELSHLADVEERVAETGQIVLTHYSPRIAMRPKVFVERQHAATMWKERAGAGHRVDGLILQKDSAPYAFGTARRGEAFKWKEKPTVDLAGPSLRSRTAPLPSTVHGRAVRVSEESKIRPRTDDDIVEYLVDASGEGEVLLFAMRRREDKASANAVKVVLSTVRDAIDAVTAEELTGA